MFVFLIVHLPFYLDDDAPVVLSYGVYILQLVRFPHVWYNVSYFIDCSFVIAKIYTMYTVFINMLA